MNKKQTSSAEAFHGGSSQYYPPQPLYPTNQSAMYGTVNGITGMNQQGQNPAIPVPQGQSNIVPDGDYSSGPPSKKTKTTTKTTGSKGPRISTSCDQCKDANSSKCFGWPCERCAKDKKTCEPASTQLGCQKCQDEGVDCSGYGKQCKNCARINKVCTYGEVKARLEGKAKKPEAVHIIAAALRNNPAIEEMIFKELENGKVAGTGLTILEHLAQRDPARQAELKKSWNTGRIQQLVNSKCDGTQTHQDVSDQTPAESNTMLSTAVQTAPAHSGGFMASNIEAAVGGVGDMGGTAATFPDDSQRDHLGHHPNLPHHAIHNNNDANPYGTIANAYPGASAISASPYDPMTEGYNAQYDASTEAPQDDLAGTHNDYLINRPPGHDIEERLRAGLIEYDNETSANANHLDNPAGTYIGNPIEHQPNPDLEHPLSAAGNSSGSISEHEVSYDQGPLTATEVERVVSLFMSRH
ncbi:uncharacterized protein F4807DRAFT_460089 [Annulohypoxylon truncatum]|uniref:uncharacterized protein n=1 Tax=Annulohypoxylon truncatum TaxID=327061 RepID=UPI0020085D50|nr:uncharacterized protein F4807DRAFT_460089 [Annulohypoxylon truncatum]KAI1210260.1 hypothetical protein F4807DRAFT_460089 [Annulohypoxylon truncatum]